MSKKKKKKKQLEQELEMSRVADEMCEDEESEGEVPAETENSTVEHDGAEAKAEAEPSAEAESDARTEPSIKSEAMPALVGVIVLAGCILLTLIVIKVCDRISEWQHQTKMEQALASNDYVYNLTHDVGGMVVNYVRVGWSEDSKTVDLIAKLESVGATGIKLRFAEEYSLFNQFGDPESDIVKLSFATTDGCEYTVCQEINPQGMIQSYIIVDDSYSAWATVPEIGGKWVHDPELSIMLGPNTYNALRKLLDTQYTNAFSSNPLYEIGLRDYYHVEKKSNYYGEVEEIIDPESGREIHQNHGTNK